MSSKERYHPTGAWQQNREQDCGQCLQQEHMVRPLLDDPAVTSSQITTWDSYSIIIFVWIFFFVVFLRELQRAPPILLYGLWFSQYGFNLVKTLVQNQKHRLIQFIKPAVLNNDVTMCRESVKNRYKCVTNSIG